MHKENEEKKPKYTPPLLVHLEVKEGNGACNNGSGDLDTCDIGNAAAGGCLDGSSGDF